MKNNGDLNVMKNV